MVPALLDDGAQFCAISEKFYVKHVEQMRVSKFKTKKKSCTADGRIMNTLSYIYLTIQLGDELLHDNFRILKDLTPGIMIGNNVC